MFHQTFLFLGQLWQLFEVSQILEFLRYHRGLTLAHSRSDGSVDSNKYGGYHHKLQQRGGEEVCV